MPDPSALRPTWALVGPRVWSGLDAGFAGDAISFTSDGRVAAVGGRRAVEADLPAGAEVHECDGTLVPAFVDAHTHVRAAASARLATDCGGDSNLSSLLGTIREAAAGAAPGQWVSVVGLQPAGFSPRLPTRPELDLAAPLNPVRIRHRSLHAWLLNSLAADRVGRFTGFPPPDRLLVDHNGLLGRAVGRISDTASLERAVREWSSERLRQGVVAILDASVTNGSDEVETLERWRRDGTLAQDVRALTGDLDPPPGPTVLGRKLMPDEARCSSAELRRAILETWQRHELVAIHCVETGTLGAIIEAVEDIAPAGRRRLRIEHASLCPEDWLPRVAAIDAVVVTHPAFVAEHGDRYRRELPASMLDWLYRLRSWSRHGVQIAIGSDEPAGPGDPLEAWKAAVSRRSADGVVIGAVERLSPAHAFAALGEWSARVSGFDGLGRLEPGALGSAVRLRGDPFGPEPEAVAVAGVVAAGRLVDCPPDT